MKRQEQNRNICAGITTVLTKETAWSRSAPLYHPTQRSDRSSKFRPRKRDTPGITCWIVASSPRTTVDFDHSTYLKKKKKKKNSLEKVRSERKVVPTRVGTLIVATIYLHLIQNLYMFRSFAVLQCSHQHCVQPVASDVEVVAYL